MIPVTGTRFELGYGQSRALSSETSIPTRDVNWVTLATAQQITQLKPVLKGRIAMVMRCLFGGIVFLLWLPASADDVLSGAEHDTVSRWLSVQKDKNELAAESPARTAPPVEQLLVRLEERLRLSAGDQSGWILLAQTYAYLGRMDDARTAADKAVTLGADSASMQQMLLAAHTERAL